MDLINDLMSGRTGRVGLDAAAILLNLVQANTLQPANIVGHADDSDIDALVVILMAAPQILFGGLGRKASMGRVARVCDKRMRRFREGKWDGWIQSYDRPQRESGADEPDEVMRCLAA